jgi:hypothetical protein
MISRSAVLLAAAALAGVVPAWAGTMYCCNDDHGRRSCGDTLPQICYGRVYREIVDGVAREVLPTPTADEKAARDAEARAKREAERAALLERRRNQALLDSYTSVQDIDYMRDRSLAGISKELKQAQDRFNELQKLKKDLAKQAAPYKKTPMPEELTAQIHANDDELLGQQRVLDTKQQEMDDIRAKFEAEKQRYLELTKKPVKGGAAAPAADAKQR